MRWFLSQVVRQLTATQSPLVQIRQEPPKIRNKLLKTVDKAKLIKYINKACASSSTG